MRASSPLRLAVWLPLLLAAGVQARDLGPPLVEHVYRLSRLPASVAVERVCPLLSARGSVEVQDGGATLVLRDTEAHIARALTALAAVDRDRDRDRDRAGRTVRMVVQIVRADSRPPGGGVAAIELPAEVVDRLHRLLRYRSYSLLARADLEATEETDSTFEVGPEFRVSFRIDGGVESGRVRMREFRVLRRDGQGELKPLVHTHLSLERGRPMILGLAPTEASERALLVVLEAAGDGETQEARG